jgi:hypothetical protein
LDEPLFFGFQPIRAAPVYPGMPRTGHPAVHTGHNP